MTPEGSNKPATRLVQLEWGDLRGTLDTETGQLIPPASDGGGPWDLYEWLKEESEDG